MSEKKENFLNLIRDVCEKHKTGTIKQPKCSSIDEWIKKV